MAYNRLPFAGELDALIAPVGTSIPMAQASAPPGWVASATNDTSFRYNSGTGGSTGGTIAWSQWNFGGTFNVNGFALSTAQLPAHNHGVNDPQHAHTYSDPAHAHAYTGPSSPGASGFQGAGAGSSINNQTTAASGISITIQNAATGITTQNTGTGSTITPTYTTPQVKYVDHILAVKS